MQNKKKPDYKRRRLVSHTARLGLLQAARAWYSKWGNLQILRTIRKQIKILSCFKVYYYTMVQKPKHRGLYAMMQAFWKTQYYSKLIIFSK